MPSEYKDIKRKAERRFAMIVSTGELLHDRKPMNEAIAARILHDTAVPVSAMNNLQIGRDSGIVGHTMLYALSYLRNQLDDPTKVYTPHPNDINWFYYDDMDVFAAETEYLEPQINADASSARDVWIHPALSELRTRETAVWAVRAGPSDWSGIIDDNDAHWCLIVANFEDRVPVIVPRGTEFSWDERTNETRDVFYDRSLKDIQIFNPLMGRNAGRSIIQRRLAVMFGHILNYAGIAFQAHQLLNHRQAYPKVRELWQTGHQCFGIAQEYFRRLQAYSNMSAPVAHGSAQPTSHQRAMGRAYVGLHNVDVLRESMLAACAARAVALSNYQARHAVELPGLTAHMESERLDPVIGPGVINPRIFDPEPVVGPNYVSASYATQNATANPW
jgi:hypothetical protein